MTGVVNTPRSTGSGAAPARQGHGARAATRGTLTMMYRPLQRAPAAALSIRARAGRFGRLLALGCLAAGLIAAARVVPGQELPPAVPGVLLHYVPVTDERLLTPEPDSWLMYRRTYDGWGFSPLNQIDASNVADLAPVWRFDTGTNDGEPQAPPIVNGETMFVTTADQVLALDAATGILRWRHVHAFPPDLRRPHSTNRGVALYDDLVYVGTLDARVVALRATTGEVVWERAVAYYRHAYYITLAPLVVNGKVIVGMSGGEFGIRGFIAALDALTGREIWRRYTIPAPGEPGSGTWSGDAWRTGGGPVWLTGTYDPGLNLTYWGVGNGGPWTGDARPGDNLYTNSTIALDADTGELRSHFQYHWNGSWDWDEASAPLVVDVERNGRTLPALVHAGRNGYLWLLDRSGGGMRFLEAEPYVHQDVFVGLDPVSGRPAYDPARVPRIGERVEFCPAMRGARNWRPEAFSPAAGMLYVPATNNLCSVMEGIPVEYRAGRAFEGAATETFRREGAEHVGELQAWNLDTGRRVWTQEFPTSVDSVLATGGGLVFADSGGTLHALDALSGDRLWSHAPERHRPSGVAASYAVRGVQYVALQFEPRSDFPDAGNIVLSFALECQC